MMFLFSLASFITEGQNGIKDVTVKSADLHYNVWGSFMDFKTLLITRYYTNPVKWYRI